MRLNCAIGMLSKLQRNANFYILKTAYHSLFESHLQYGTQLWGQKNKEITKFQKLQNCALRKITFKKCHNCISCVYKECKIYTEISRHPKSLSFYVPNPAQPQTQHLFSYSLCQRQAQLQHYISNTQSFRYSSSKNKYVREKLY